MDRVRFTTDERLDVPDAHALDDLPDAATRRVLLSLLGASDFVAGTNRVASLVPFALSNPGTNTLRVNRMNGTGALLFDRLGRTVGGPWSAQQRDIPVTSTDGTYFVNVRWVESAGTEVLDGEGQQETRVKRIRSTGSTVQFQTSTRRLDSWEVQTNAGTLDATVLDAGGSVATADAGWITIGTVTIAAGVISAVTPRDGSFYLARYNDTRSQSELLSLKDVYDAIISVIHEMRAKPVSINSWLSAVMVGLTTRGFVFPSDTTAHGGPELKVLAGAGEKGIIRVAKGTGSGNPDRTVIVPEDNSVALSLGKDTDDHTAQAVLDSLILDPAKIGNATLAVQSAIRAPLDSKGVVSLVDQDAIVAGVLVDAWGAYTPLYNALWSEDFIHARLGAAATDTWTAATVGAGAAAIAEDTAGTPPSLGTARLASGVVALDHGTIHIPTQANQGAGIKLNRGGVRLRVLYLVNVATAGTQNIFRAGHVDPTDAGLDTEWVAAVYDVASSANWKIQGRTSAATTISTTSTVAVVPGTYTWLDLRVTSEDSAELWIGLGPAAQGPFTISAGVDTWYTNTSRMGGQVIRANAGGADGVMYVDRIVLMGPPA